MYLENLQLINFKNYPEATLEFCDKINCFTGDNGTGKTNLLDAIHYLSFCKSYFNLIDAQNIRHNESFFAVHGSFVRNGDQRDSVSCTLEKDKRKSVKFNKKEYERLADHIGVFPLVMVSPQDANLINEGSEERRRFLDAFISQFDKVYLDDLISYNRILQQRNKLLRTFAEQRHYDPESLMIWDAQMAAPADRIFNRRASFVKDFTPLFDEYFNLISGGREFVTLEYESHLFAAGMSELLDRNLTNDRNSQYTTRGIHKDDLRFGIGGYPIRKFGSQGQQKSFTIAIKLAQFEYTKRVKGFKPILLFDDVFDKLDHTRVQRLVSLVSEQNFGQVFITDTQKERIFDLVNKVNSPARVFHVTDGVILPLTD